MDQDDDMFKLPPPLTLDDKLFGADGPWQAIAMLDSQMFKDIQYVDGFRRAAEVLCDHVINHSRGDANWLVMPVLFGYRHWAELRLKDLWLLGARHRGETVEPRRTHDLLELWRLVRPTIEPMGGPEHQGELDALEAILGELAQDGPRAEGFRYAETSKGEVSLPPELSRINLATVRHVMERVRLILDGATDMLYADLEQDTF